MPKQSPKRTTTRTRTKTKRAKVPGLNRAALLADWLEVGRRLFATSDPRWFAIWTQSQSEVAGLNEQQRGKAQPAVLDMSATRLRAWGEDQVAKGRGLLNGKPRPMERRWGLALIASGLELIDEADDKYRRRLQGETGAA